MSTRCNIHFNYSDEIIANIYRHSDGYPDGVLPDLQTFFKEVKEHCGSDTRFNDPSYLAAKYVVWEANENAILEAKYSRSKTEPKRLAFLGVGVTLHDAPDGEYVYKVNCDKHDANGFPVVTYTPDDELDRDEEDE
jgi:hypothetical protein